MYCPICATRIHGSLVALDGVLKAQVNHLAGVVDVIFDSNFTSVPALIRAVIQAGNDNQFRFQAANATSAQPKRLSNTLTRSPYRPDKGRLR
ncbi:hypothetical protein ANRL4_02080 [Anaerolineae bacterium]|nr:hypothetical protein ANRL4_02080 [Anaerolineae bacterium]